MNLYHFNPSHDSVLAANIPHFTPPKAARQMEESLGLLAAWIANDGDLVLVPKAKVMKDFAASSTLMPKVELISLGTNLKDKEIDKYLPWGYDILFLERMEKCMCNNINLLYDQSIKVRHFSSRSWAVEMLYDICENGKSKLWCGQSRFCYTIEEINNACELFGEVIMKMPYSSSGRGLRLGYDNAWIESGLRKQGAIEVEKMLDKSLDFALEYQCNKDGNVSYIGLSLFSNSDKGAYTGNIVANEEALVEILTNWIDNETFEALKLEHKRVISKYIGKEYEGVIGIDCLVCNDGKVCPMIEMNLRQTMGYYAICLRKYLAKGVMAHFFIDYDADNSRLQMRSNERKKPILDEEGKLLSGCLPLTPIINGQSTYQAWISVDE